MDIGCLKFAHNLVTTAAIYHMASEPLALSVSGLRRQDIADCVEWMVPFAAVLHETGTLPARHFPDIPEDDQHNIQVSGDFHISLFYCMCLFNFVFDYYTIIVRVFDYLTIIVRIFPPIFSWFMCVYILLLLLVQSFVCL